MILELTLDRFEGDYAVLKTADNMNINWPKEKLPAGLPAGSVLKFIISDLPAGKAGNAGQAEEKSEAKKILNELLDINGSA